MYIYIYHVMSTIRLLKQLNLNHLVDEFLYEEISRVSRV